jgi:glycosyltransferase involved in cell wall biosynthesis
MKPKIWIFSLEPIDTRYTGEWFTHVPNVLQEQLSEHYDVCQVNGIQADSELTPGAFLNFSDTNYWKSSQLCQFLAQLNGGNVGPNDHILLTDAWNPVVVQLKYMKELLGYNWTLHGLWHAGSYDPQDFLGRLIGNKPWVRNVERSMFDCFDHNYFATKFHIKLFCEEMLNFTPADTLLDTKIVRSGWPMEYLRETLAPLASTPKKNRVIFPHRIAPEKQVEIFRDLASQLPQYEFVVCQDTKLTKSEYHQLLAESKVVFSANLQETLGIGVYEGALVGAIPMVPDRLSYTEMYDLNFKYPSEWTASWDSYQQNRKSLVDKIDYAIKFYDYHTPSLNKLVDKLHSDFFSCDSFINQIGK